MRLHFPLTSLLLMLVFSSLFAQETPSSSDSLAAEKRKEYEARLKHFEEVRRRMERDPGRFADSIARIRENRRYDDAMSRIAGYIKGDDLAEVVELDLTGARLTAIPEWVFRAKKLEILILDHNQISVLPERLAELSSLRRIYWKYNRLGEKRLKIPKLEGIEKIDLTGNLLSKLPKVHRLDGLEELVLQNNAFTKIPTWRGRRLKELKELDMSLNPVELDRRWYWLLDHYKILKLNKCEISEIHPSLYKMDGLKELQIQMNKLENIPEGISGLENLTKLSFYKNDLTFLPDDFFDLKKLRVIDLYYNEFEKIPADIGKMDSLEILYLSFNALYDIPKEIGQLSELEELYIHHNRLSEIPLSVASLKKLHTFHFQENYIPSFPNQILEMKNLIDLDISNTDIRAIPLGITDLNLRNFYWRNLEINFNDPDNESSRKALMSLMEQGTNVVPHISMEEVYVDD